MLLQQRYMPVHKLFDVGQREVKGARSCYCRIYHMFVNFIILNLFKVVKLRSCLFYYVACWSCDTVRKLMHQTAQNVNKY